MSERAKAFTIAGVILIAVWLIGAFSLGLSIGRDQSMNKTAVAAMPDQPTNKLSYEEHALIPYTGVGSGVLRHGTILKENYNGPASIIGVLDIPGIWVLEGVE